MKYLVYANFSKYTAQKHKKVNKMVRD